MQSEASIMLSGWSDGCASGAIISTMVSPEITTEPERNLSAPAIVAFFMRVVLISMRLLAFLRVFAEPTGYLQTYHAEKRLAEYSSAHL